MIWGALRFSDVQRVEAGSIQVQDSIVRGRCVRTKSSRDGMPFGVLCLGIYDGWHEGVAKLLSAVNSGSFLLSGPEGKKANFAFTLGHFRRLLIQVGGLSALQASRYTLHSFKTTGLTWALQLDISSTQRRLWGHHRSSESGAKMACKYSHDVLPALRAQLLVLQSIRAGWVPLTPQSRGASPPAPETPLEPVYRCRPVCAKVRVMNLKQKALVQKMTAPAQTPPQLPPAHPVPIPKRNLRGARRAH